MSELPYFPFYPQAYMGGTRHLTTLQHGIYGLLIYNYYLKGKLPNDEKLLARIAGLPMRVWLKNRDVIAAFFQPDWTHKRIDAELAKMGKVSAARSQAGQLGAAARVTKKESYQSSKFLPTNGTNPLQTKETDSANGSQCEKEKGREEESNDSSSKKGCSAGAECPPPAKTAVAGRDPGTDLLGDVIPEKSVAAARRMKADLAELGEKWNEIAAERKLRSIDFIQSGSQRERHAVARLRELSDDYQVSISDFLAKIDRSPFLRGDKGGFQASFDWICNPTNFTKIMEGNYEDQRQKTNRHVNGHDGPHH